MTQLDAIYILIFIALMLIVPLAFLAVSFLLIELLEISFDHPMGERIVVLVVDLILSSIAVTCFVYHYLVSFIPKG